jgi:iron complex transport system substrate-binding protein
MCRLRSPFAATAVLAALFLAGCAGEEPGPTASGPTVVDSPTAARSEAPAAFPVTVTDDDGVEVTLEEAPDRLATWGPSNTEVLFALGLGEKVVGVSSRFDDFPPEARSIPKIGFDVNVEKLVSLEPDLVLAIRGGDEWKDQAGDLGIQVLTLDATTLDDLFGDIETVGRVTGTTEEAATLVADLRAEAEALQAEAQGVIEESGPVSCFFEVFFGPPLYSVGPGSFVFDLLERAGCDPVTADAGGADVQLSVEAVLRADPDVYLVADDAAASVQDVAGREGYQTLSAVRNDRVVLVDADLVTRQGPRAVDGLGELVEAIHR